MKSVVPSFCPVRQGIKEPYLCPRHERIAELYNEYFRCMCKECIAISIDNSTRA